MCLESSHSFTSNRRFDSTNGVAAIRCQRRALSRSLRDYFLGYFSIVDSPESADIGAKWLEAQWRRYGLCVF